jgi:hypothetical protein
MDFSTSKILQNEVSPHTGSPSKSGRLIDRYNCMYDTYDSFGGENSQGVGSIQIDTCIESQWVNMIEIETNFCLSIKLC